MSVPMSSVATESCLVTTMPAACKPSVCQLAVSGYKTSLSMLLAAFLLLEQMTWTLALPELIRIGGLFDDSEDPAIETAFSYAINRVNQDDTLLSNTRIAYDIQHLPSSNSFMAAKRACNQAGLGVASVFGPRSSMLAGHINSMCNTLEIPHLETRLEPRPTPAKGHLFSVNLYPEAAKLSQAVLALIKHFNWTRFCIIYGDQNDLLLLQDILRAPTKSDAEITVRQAKMDNLRETLKELHKRGFTKIMAHLSADYTHALLKAALQVGMIDPTRHYILTNLDIDTVDLGDFRHNHANITAMRLINREQPRVKDILQQMADHQTRTGTRLLNATDPPIIKTEAALMFDAIHVLAHALQQVDTSTRLRLVNLSCDGDQAWAFGSSLYGYLNLVEMEGITGSIAFDRGRRLDFQLDILQLRVDGLKKVGVWSTRSGISFSQSFHMANQGDIFANRTLVVTTIKEKPYLELRSSELPLKGNDRYQGFCVDLLKEISKEMGFDYRIEIVPDGQYGAPDDDGNNWNGMVNEIISKRADLAVAPLTINFLREGVIDFTKPFMNLGISILFKKPRPESPGLFSFLNPLAFEIWLYVIAAYFIVSLMMFVLARFSPYEWYNPHPCNTDCEVMENMFTLSNSFWFAVGTLMQQGSDINPRAVSTRIVGGIWWFFTLIIISSYTANLAAFLTVERMVSPIENAEDLSKQTRIGYGTMKEGSTMTFFRESKIPTYQRMWSFMKNHEDEMFVHTSEEGVRKVAKENYAYLMESTMIDYTIQRDCDLMQVGGLLDSKGYGIGTQIGSPYRDPISLAILGLQESGRIQILYNKWWKNTGTCSNDEAKGQDGKANSLGVANVGGIFVVLFVGLALAVICAVAEFLWNSRKNAAADRQSLWSEMIEELRFAIRCHGSTKKPALKRQCSKCLHHPGETCAVDSPNGVLHLRDMKRCSPIPSPLGGHLHDHASHRPPNSHFRYHNPYDTMNDHHRDMHS